MIVPDIMFFLASAAEARDSFEVADNSRCEIDIARVAAWTFADCSFFYMLALIANRDLNISTEVITTFSGGLIQKIKVLAAG